ncbi:LysR substrate-binding domain-containing protein [Sneathiella marina]|uniref:LysR substrate-binding domain-containing protein n=1 Tax=Sneathiella marina TaxID=2950108 RepID=A0ABY4W4B3_9PROT|nr:LysR substrate-binding domain-containing protein [Sneathiella marina]USG62023.1 LysR substrate-binding domain-containing protein [Sneathiella marina]
MSIKPTLRQLEYFISLAETGHFGEAANLCNVSQPTLSSQFKLLEDRLGATLIERNPGQISVTPTGRMILELSKTVFTAVNEIQNVAKNASGNLGGALRLGVIPNFGAYILPFVMQGIHKRFPELEFFVQETRDLELQDGLLSGKIDCALMLSLDHPGIEQSPFLTESIRLGFPYDHPLAQEPTIKIGMLKDEHFLFLVPLKQLPSKVQNFFIQSGGHIRYEIEGPNLDSLRHMVSIGMGITVFPELYIKSEFSKDTRIILRDVEGWELSRELVLAWRKGSVRKDQYLQFLEECKAAIEPARKGCVG